MSATFSAIGKQILIYGGIPVLAGGILGDLLNTLVFLSLRTFRQSSCVFYLTVMSIVNIGQLFFGLFSRIMVVFQGVDGTESSLFYCKLKFYLFQVCMGTSLTCLCLATIDQYFATSARPRWQLWCNIKLARYIVLISVIIWCIHGIPYLIYYNHVLSVTTNVVTCTGTNYAFSQYRAFVILIVLIGYLPVTIATLFGLLAFYNVRQMAYRTVPLVRRELDRQLTVMVLVQVVVSIFTVLPYTTANGLANSISISDSTVQAKLQFAVTITLVIYYTYFASPLYIYICVSKRFRRQLMYVLFTMHLNQWKQPRVGINQVMPES